MKIKHAAVTITLILTTSGCMVSKVERLTDYTPPSTYSPKFDQNAVEEYFFLSWEPYHFIFTLGLLPQYHYVVYENRQGEYEKHSRMIGWCAIPLPLFSSWKYGDTIHEEKPNQAMLRTLRAGDR